MCEHKNQGPLSWSQDGWVSWCRDCRSIVYHGDNYDEDPSCSHAQRSKGCLMALVFSLIVWCAVLYVAFGLE